MSRKPENQFVAGVHKYLPPTLYRVKMANPYVSGIPDWWYSGTACDLWLEYKYLPRMRERGIIKPDLSALQGNWLGNRYLEGRNVRVVVGCPLGAVVYVSPSEWDEGIDHEHFRSRLVDRRTLAGRIMETVSECVESVASSRKRHLCLAVDSGVVGNSGSASG